MSAVSSETDGMRHGPRSRVAGSRRISQVAASGPKAPECPMDEVSSQGAAARRRPWSSVVVAGQVGYQAGSALDA
jgi:hypothetical protein